MRTSYINNKLIGKIYSNNISINGINNFLLGKEEVKEEITPIFYLNGKDFLDHSGNNTEVINNGVTITDNGYNFDGLSNLLISSDNNIFTLDNDWTIEVECSFNQFSAIGAALFEYGRYAADGILGEQYQQSLYFYAHSTNLGAHLIQINEIFRCKLINDSVNNKLHISVNNSSIIVNNAYKINLKTFPLKIGNGNYGNYPFIGTIKYFKIYNLIKNE